MLTRFERQGSCAVLFNARSPSEWLASFCGLGLMKLLKKHVPNHYRGIGEIRFDESIQDGEDIIICRRDDALLHFHWAFDSGAQYATCSTSHFEELINRSIKENETFRGKFTMEEL